VRFYSYSEFVNDVKRLKEIVDKDFDAVIAVARGGLTLSHFLAEAMEIRNVFSINSIGYEDKKKLENVEVFNIPKLDSEKKILVVDDIVDSGDTIKEVLKKLKEEYSDKIFLSATIFYKNGAIVKPDFFIKRTDEWIEFFWTKDTTN
jgi:xanthine phosphoribosyltransferase